MLLLCDVSENALVWSLNSPKKKKIPEGEERDIVRERLKELFLESTNE